MTVPLGTAGAGMATQASPASPAAAPTPPLFRRMACFLYEATLLFGLGLVPGIVGALFFAQTGQRHPLQSDVALRAFALLFYGVYFIWFWAARGQTLAMQTWRIRLVTTDGARLSQWRALGRYAACCVAWFLPATLMARWLELAPLASLAASALGVAAYALLALAEPQRQFWHDRLCGTRLVDVRGEGRPTAV